MEAMLATSWSAVSVPCMLQRTCSTVPRNLPDPAEAQDVVYAVGMEVLRQVTQPPLPPATTRVSASTSYIYVMTKQDSFCSRRQVTYACLGLHCVHGTLLNNVAGCFGQHTWCTHNQQLAKQLRCLLKHAVLTIGSPLHPLPPSCMLGNPSFAH